MIGALLERTAVRDWRAVTTLFFVSTLLESLAWGHMVAFTPLFLERDLTLPLDQVGPWSGLLAAMTFGVAFPLAPLWGALAERYSRKLIIVRSQYLEALGYVLCAFAPDLTWFIVGRLILGLTFGNIAIVIASQSLLTPEKRMASAIAVVQAANPIATSLGPPMGALLIPLIGIRGLFFLDGVACLVAAILVTFLMPEPPGRNRTTSVMSNMRRAMAAVWARPPIRWNFVAWYLTRGSMSIVDTYLPVRITELARTDPAPAIGLILGVYGVLTSVATWVTGRVVDRYGAARMFWPGMAVASVSVVGMALAPWLWLVAAFAWARSVPMALTGTVLYAHLAQVLRREERAPVMSLTPLPRNVAAFSMPLVSGFFALIGTAPALLVGAVGYGLGVWVGLRLMRSSAADAEASAETSPPVTAE